MPFLHIYFSISKLYLLLLALTASNSTITCKIIDTLGLGGELLLIQWFEALCQILLEWKDGFNPRELQGVGFSLEHSSKTGNTASCGRNAD